MSSKINQAQRRLIQASEVFMSTTYTLNKKDLPVHCPPDNAELWAEHPRVFLTLDKEGRAVCPYCNTHFVLAADPA